MFVLRLPRGFGRISCVAWCLGLGISLEVQADEAPPSPATPTTEELRAGAEKSLLLLERSVREYRTQQECFSCHHQAIPTFALVEARRRGFALDAENLQASLELTAQHLENGRQQYLDGKGQGGKVDTAGYALWTLAEGAWKPNETTAAVAEYLLHSPKTEEDHWRRTSQRPPSEASDFTTTLVAIRGLQVYGTESQQAQIAGRFEKTLNWLKSHPGEDTEARVMRLRALRLLNADDATRDEATHALLAAQRDDGGWSQIDALPSDAYATGTALAALHQAGNLPTDDAVYRRGVQFLLDTQLDDGSWRVASRSKPFQTYFESGFPHGKDQFISIAASSWATLALVLSLPAAEQ